MRGIHLVRRGGAAGLCLTLALLAGCAGGAGHTDTSPQNGSSPRERPAGERTAERTFDLLRVANSMQLSFAVRAPQGGAVISVHADRDGNCTGTFDMGRTQRGDIIRVAGEGVSYIRYTDVALAEIRAEAARRGPEAAAQADKRTAEARGKYLRVPSINSAVREQCDLDKALSKVPQNGVGVQQQPVVQRNGESFIPLRGPEGDEGLTMYVAAQGEPYIRFMEGSDQGAEMRVAFSHFNEPVHASAPPADQVLDIGSGGQGLLGA
ncbi:hypothetical protein [Streptomyces sp. NPDC002825]|uniref:hypothetical protein n=1 Tax=Streptomyces sp. NPDC002825 TaxID=3154666 RepID=UPI0033272654